MRKQTDRASLSALLLSFILLILFLGTIIGPIMPVCLAITSGGSMFPTMETGDMAVGVSALILKPKVGDIAVYHSEEGYIVHRIIHIGNGYAVFKGDNNPNADGEIPLNDIYFVIVAIIPPYIWVPVLAIVLGGEGVYLFYRCRNKKTYNGLVAVYFFMVLVISFVLINDAISLLPSYPVKPNPLPQMAGYTVYKNTVAIFFDQNIQNYTFKAIANYNGHTVYLDHTAQGYTLIIDTVPLQRLCNTPSCATTINILYHPNTPYNVTVSYMLELVITRGNWHEKVTIG